MNSVAIDASVFAVPLTEATPDAIERYLSILSDWSKLTSSRIVKPYVSQRGREILCKIGRYPDARTLKIILASCHNSNEFPVDTNTIIQYMRGLENSTEELENVSGINYILKSDEIYSPDLCSTLDNEDLKEEL